MNNDKTYKNHNKKINAISKKNHYHDDPIYGKKNLNSNKNTINEKKGNKTPKNHRTKY